MDLLEFLWLGKPLWMWLAFLAIVVILLALDIGLLHRDTREIGVKESLALSAGYASIGLAFGGWVWWQLGAAPALQYVTGFVVEKSLAMDNVFVIAMIFSYFAIPRQYQHRVLFWGVLGVIVLRAIMIGVGVDYTIHYLWRYRELRRTGMSPEESVIETMNSVGRGILFNALSVVFGFSILFLSNFLPVRFFGFLVVVSIGGCLVAAFLLLPSLCVAFRPGFAEPKKG